MIRWATRVMVLAVGLVVMGGVGSALAAWIAGGTGTSSAGATTVLSGTTPTVSVSGRDVTVIWPAATLATGAPVSGYTLRRFDTGNTPQPVGAGCSGTVAALTCIEQAVPAGAWTYAVTPVQGAWTGVEGPRSGSATVDPSALVLTPFAFSSIPTTLTGSVTAFATGETITFRLDDPVTGTVLASTITPDPIPLSGSSSVSVTIPVGTGAGPHTVYAIGSLGTQANIGILRDDAVPGVGAAVVQKVQGGAAGFVHQGGQYFVYASVADNGSPPSGLQSVAADMSAVTSGQTAAPMTSGTWTVASTTYNYRSPLLTADALLAAGAKAFSITATDLAANVATQGGFSVMVDNAAPSVTALVIQKAAGGAAGAVAQGGQYFVYANVTDAGGSGLESVIANAVNLSTGQSAAVMSSGSWTVGATTYNYRSALLTANNPLTQGVTTFTVTASDGAANATTSPATNVTVDNTAPTIAALVIQKSAGGVAGSIRQGGQYFVYASVTDTGGAGVESVTADVSTVTTGQVAAPLAAGIFTVGGTSYNYRSAVLTANNPLTAGAKAYTVTASDGAGNATTSGIASVTVDNTVPTATNVQTANAAAGTVGHAEVGDTITYTYSEPMEPVSFLAGWTGAATSVTVRLNNVGAGDTITIFNAGNTAALPFGTVSLGRTDYTAANRTFTTSTMVMSGNTITITLGTASGATGTAAANGTMTWTPSATATDVAGNACSAVAVTEGGAADREF